jgi:predicted nucleic acid-binding Zn ribbon protein
MPRAEYEEFDERDPDDDQGPSLTDRDDPDEADIDDGDEPEFVPCPYCRKPIPEDAAICPRCGNFIVDDAAPRRRPWWIWIGVILCLLGVLFWAF